MKISFVQIQNFRKLKNCKIEFGDNETLFVGPNNSGKTSAMEALVKFLNNKPINFNDITVLNHKNLNEIGEEIIQKEFNCENSDIKLEEVLPSIDIWIYVQENEMQYVANLIPNLDWNGGLVGVRLAVQPNSLEDLCSNYKEEFEKARKLEKADSDSIINIWPIDFCDYLKKKILSSFSIKTYILDCEKIDNIEDIPQKIDYDLETTNINKIIKVDVIEAQRGFYDPDTNYAENESRTLSSQIRKYYDKHLDPEKSPTEKDLNILKAMQDASKAFDENLKEKFKDTLSQVENMGYPGINNPKIRIESKVNAIDSIKHESAIQYEIPHMNADKEIYHLPEQYNGLGYQNLISIIFKLITFRDEWTDKNKKEDESNIEPIHLVLLEEPEAHLHMQVQQVFIKKAYEVLTNNEFLIKNKNFITQLVVTTHSSYIVKEMNFCNLRYFKRLPINDKNKIPTTTVINLSKVFAEKKGEKYEEENQTKRFATRYLKITHCDIFFADAVILVEGAAERMLVPHFIKNSYKNLNKMYISILEINGRHSHRLKPLIENIGINTLIITDIDSVSPDGNHKSMEPKKEEGLITTNNSITNWIMNEKRMDNLIVKTEEEKVKEYNKNGGFKIRIAYQIPIEFEFNKNNKEVLASTFEDSLIYSNFEFFKNCNDEKGPLGQISKIINDEVEFNGLHTKLYNIVRRSDFKKAELALDLIYEEDPKDIKIPNYIKEGLDWLEKILSDKYKIEKGE